MLFRSPDRPFGELTAGGICGIVAGLLGSGRTCGVRASRAVLKAGGVGVGVGVAAALVALAVTTIGATGAATPPPAMRTCTRSLGLEGTKQASRVPTSGISATYLNRDVANYRSVRSEPIRQTATAIATYAARRSYSP